MSKIGKINISIPEKVKVALAGNIINIEGPLGIKSINVDWWKDIIIEKHRDQSIQINELINSFQALTSNDTHTHTNISTDD